MMHLVLQVLFLRFLPFFRNQEAFSCWLEKMIAKWSKTFYFLWPQRIAVKLIGFLGFITSA